jgi:hypothetical protein
MEELTRLGLSKNLQFCTQAPSVPAAPAAFFHLQLCNPRIAEWMPGFNTLGLCSTLGLHTQTSDDDLLREIWLALLASPIVLNFPSAQELLSAVRIRQFTVNAARKTSMDFHTMRVERPLDCWTHHEDTGFTVRPGKPLVQALLKATQPDVSGSLYSFSCYRATEYVILLAVAQEAQTSNPALLAQLQAQWEVRAVMSGRFHDVFLREYGSMEQPLPIGYYIPGDRIWFRNPDDASSDVAGYEGSWVFYLSDGLFPNFWNRDKPYSVFSKCIEVYHWRNATYRDAQGELQMDESIVAQQVQETLNNPPQAQRIYQRMFRLRDPKGVYAEGGCMDTTRESVRWVRPDTVDIVMPGTF